MFSSRYAVDLCLKHLITIYELYSQISHTSIIREQRLLPFTLPLTPDRKAQLKVAKSLLPAAALPALHGKPKLAWQRPSTHSCCLLTKSAAELSPPVAPQTWFCLRSMLAPSSLPSSSSPFLPRSSHPAKGRRWCCGLPISEWQNRGMGNKIYRPKERACCRQVPCEQARR